MSLKQELAEYRAGWFKRVPAERQAIMERHIAQLRNGLAKTALKVGDRAPSIVLSNARGDTVDVGTLLKRGPVVVAFYRGGWCPFCNLELRAFQRLLPDIEAAGASLVAISPEKLDDSLSTAEKNSLTFEVLSDVGQKVGRAFRLVYEFSDELKSAYKEFGLDIPAKNGAPSEWALPISATYIIDRDGVITYAYTDADYRDRADPIDILTILKRTAAAA
ncbi:MAG TPA: peroxiredoxin-like family protein [Xanthobacteraceae bacterium]|jgi:peroxiredoxin|nr:peroxiredoxin-like family protein [Xanthobacteraceae bacterium]